LEIILVSIINRWLNELDYKPNALDIKTYQHYIIDYKIAETIYKYNRATMRHYISIIVMSTL